MNDACEIAQLWIDRSDEDDFLRELASQFIKAWEAASKDEQKQSGITQIILRAFTTHIVGAILSDNHDTVPDGDMPFLITFSKTAGIPPGLAKLLTVPAEELSIKWTEQRRKEVSWGMIRALISVAVQHPVLKIVTLRALHAAKGTSIDTDEESGSEAYQQAQALKTDTQDAFERFAASHAHNEDSDEQDHTNMALLLALIPFILPSACTLPGHADGICCEGDQAPTRCPPPHHPTTAPTRTRSHVAALHATELPHVLDQMPPSATATLLLYPPHQEPTV
jgi:hypothetical protein